MGNDYEDNANSVNSDEDTQHFLNSLDAAAVRVFEAYTERMATESSTIGLPPSKKILLHSPSFLQDEGLTSDLNQKNTIYPPLNPSSALVTEPQMRRKRRRIWEQDSFQQLGLPNQLNLGLDGKNLLPNRELHFLSWPQNFTFHSNVMMNKSALGLESNQSSLLVKNHLQLPRKSPYTRNWSTAGSFALDGTNVASKKEAEDKSREISKEIEDAISRIECLISSLLKLVISVHSPEQKSVANEGLPNISSSATYGETILPKTETSNMYTTPSSRTSGRIAQENGQALKMIKAREFCNRNTLIEKSVKGYLQNKVAPHHNQISKEASRSTCSSSATTQQISSPSYSSATTPHRSSPSYSSATTEQSGSPSSSNAETQQSGSSSSNATIEHSGSSSPSSWTYESSISYDTDESEQRHVKVGHSTWRKQPKVIQNTPSYDDTSSDYHSLDESSDASSLSQVSSKRACKWGPQKERGKRRRGLRRLGRKLGVVFHHHHHHHHHHYRDESDAHQARSIWKRLGEMFHHTRNDKHHKKLKDEKPRKSEVNTVVKRKQQCGHFHALVDGLIRHMKHPKPKQVKNGNHSKPKQVKNGIKRLGSSHYGGQNKGKKLPWWPNIHGRKGGVKVPNKKGKIGFEKYRTKSFAAAKMILKK